MPIFTVPIHEHGEPGDPDYPHGKGKGPIRSYTTDRYNWRGGGIRSPNAVTANPQRLESADGGRWATGRNVKRQLGYGKFDVVDVWALKRRVKGKVVTVATGRGREDAEKWVAGTDVLEHGTPGQPNYPHGKGGATRLPAGVSMAVDTVTAKRLGYLAFVETKHEGRTVGRLVLVDPESPAAGSGAREGLFDPDYAVTAQIDIDPPWRGQKLASALYTRAVKFAKAEGFRGIQAGQLNTTSERYWKQWLEAGKAKLAWKNRGSVMVLEHGNLGDKDYPHPMGRGSGEWSTERSRMTAGRHATKGEMRPATAADRKKYAIPPAYTNAMVATDPKAELRATAYSPATGKTASYYTKAYKERQAAAKWSRVMSVHRDMPTLWRKISTSKDQEAMTLRVILRTGLRNGNEGQGEEKAYGASNLRMEHVSVDGDTVRLQFPGKSGVAQDHSFTDPVVADYVRKREKAGAETLFDHTADDTLSYLRQISGGKKLKVHDLRTWHGTVLADALVTTAVREGLIPKTAKEFKAFRKQIGTHVAKALGNTPAVTLSTYIHPSVFRPLEVKK